MRLEDGRLQGKGKGPTSSQCNKDYHPKRFQRRTRWEPRVSSMDLTQQTKGVNVMFKDSVYKILKCIKNEPYFRWLRKMGRDPTRRNQSLYCTYHREKGHTTKQCRVLKDHLEQLVIAGHSQEFLVGQGRISASQGLGSRSNNKLPLPLGIIEVIHATSIEVSVSCRRGILSVVTPPEAKATDRLEKKLRRTSVPIIFGETNLEGTSQPHTDALVVTLRIGGFLVKRVMIDQKEWD